MSLPLSGVRVLDFGHVVTGPFATSQLADFGADVIKVESATAIDPGRRLGPFRPDRPRGPNGSALFAGLNRNKRSVAINLKNPRGTELALALVGRCDVLVENFSAGVMERLGLGPGRVQAQQPDLIYLSMPGLGHTGPRAHWVSFNIVIQALSGQMLTTGSPGDAPLAVANSWADFIAGLHGALVIAAALALRDEHGHGWWIDLSQYEANVLPLGHLVLASQRAGHAIGRLGNRSASHSPQGCYRCQREDEWCALSVTSDSEWRALVEVLGDDDLPGARYRSVEDRLAHADEIDRKIETWTQQRPPAEAERILQGAGVPAAAVRSTPGVMADLTQFVPSSQSMLHPDIGAMPAFPNPIHFDGEPARSHHAGPTLGEHTDEVLYELLGKGAAECDQLRADGVLI